MKITDSSNLDTDLGTVDTEQFSNPTTHLLDSQPTIIEAEYIEYTVALEELTITSSVDSMKRIAPAEHNFMWPLISFGWRGIPPHSNTFFSNNSIQPFDIDGQINSRTNKRWTEGQAENLIPDFVISIGLARGINQSAAGIDSGNVLLENSTDPTLVVFGTDARLLSACFASDYFQCPNNTRNDTRFPEANDLDNLYQHQWCPKIVGLSKFLGLGDLSSITKQDLSFKIRWYRNGLSEICLNDIPIFKESQLSHSPTLVKKTLDTATFDETCTVAEDSFYEYVRPLNMFFTLFGVNNFAVVDPLVDTHIVDMSASWKSLSINHTIITDARQSNYINEFDTEGVNTFSSSKEFYVNRYSTFRPLIEASVSEGGIQLTYDISGTNNIEYLGITPNEDFYPYRPTGAQNFCATFDLSSLDEIYFISTLPLPNLITDTSPNKYPIVLQPTSYLIGPTSNTIIGKGKFQHFLTAYQNLAIDTYENFDSFSDIKYSSVKIDGPFPSLYVGNTYFEAPELYHDSQLIYRVQPVFQTPITPNPQTEGNFRLTFTDTDATNIEEGGFITSNSILTGNGRMFYLNTLDQLIWHNINPDFSLSSANELDLTPLNSSIVTNANNNYALVTGFNNTTTYYKFINTTTNTMNIIEDESFSTDNLTIVDSKLLVLETKGYGLIDFGNIFAYISDLFDTSVVTPCDLISSSSSIAFINSVLVISYSFVNHTLTLIQINLDNEVETEIVDKLEDIYLTEIPLKQINGNVYGISQDGNFLVTISSNEGNLVLTYESIGFYTGEIKDFYYKGNNFYFVTRPDVDSEEGANLDGIRYLWKGFKYPRFVGACSADGTADSPITSIDVNDDLPMGRMCIRSNGKLYIAFGEPGMREIT